MAYVVVLAEGEAASALRDTWAQGAGRLRTHTRTDGGLVLYDTNLAREFVRDVKAKVSAGKLVIFSCGDPQEVLQPGGTP